MNDSGGYGVPFDFRCKPAPEKAGHGHAIRTESGGEGVPVQAVNIERRIVIYDTHQLPGVIIVGLPVEANGQDNRESARHYRSPLSFFSRFSTALKHGHSLRRRWHVSCVTKSRASARSVAISAAILSSLLTTHALAAKSAPIIATTVVRSNITACNSMT